jgi:hypothetical protein
MKVKLTSTQRRLLGVIASNPSGSNYEWSGLAIMSLPTLKRHLKSLYDVYSIVGNGSERRRELIEIAGGIENVQQ